MMKYIRFCRPYMIPLFLIIAINGYTQQEQKKKQKLKAIIRTSGNQGGTLADTTQRQEASPLDIPDNR